MLELVLNNTPLTSERCLRANRASTSSSIERMVLIVGSTQVHVQQVQTTVLPVLLQSKLFVGNLSSTLHCYRACWYSCCRTHRSPVNKRARRLKHRKKTTTTTTPPTRLTTTTSPTTTTTTTTTTSTSTSTSTMPNVRRLQSRASKKVFH